MDHTVTHNVARRNARDGFHIRGEGHVIENNVSGENLEDGFDVDCCTGGITDDIMLIDNDAINNNAVGIELSSGVTGVTVTGNTAQNNRLDFCDDADDVTMDGGGNNFGTAATECYVDEVE